MFQYNRIIKHVQCTMYHIMFFNLFAHCTEYMHIEIVKYMHWFIYTYWWIIKYKIQKSFKFPLNDTDKFIGWYTIYILKYSEVLISLWFIGIFMTLWICPMHHIHKGHNLYLVRIHKCVSVRHFEGYPAALYVSRIKVYPGQKSRNN